MENFIDNRVEKCPSTVYYIPNFINKDEEDYLLQKVNDAPKPKWVQLKNRRLQNWGGLPELKGMIQETIPDWLDKYCTKLTDLKIFDSFKPNHILVNEYKSGQGIMPHEDGLLYFPTVSTISLGSYTMLDFYKPLAQTEEKNDRFMFSLLLEPCSLLILKDDMYKVYLHGIKETEQDIFEIDKIANYEHLTTFKNNADSTQLNRGTRVSLTIRYVPKVLKLNTSSFLFNNNKARSK